MNRFILAALFLVACNGEDFLLLPDPTTGSSSTVGSGGAGGQGGHGGASSSSGVGGEGGAMPMPGDESGTRLRRKLFTSPDGLKMAASLGYLHDTLLDVDCYIATTPDDVSRCMPYTAASLVFADPTCTDQVLAFSNPCSAPLTTKFVSIAPAPVSGCNPGPTYTRWYHVGATLGAVSTYQKVGASCTPTVLTGYEFHALGAEVNYSAFAPLSLGVE